jgi:kinetochore protein Mis13/DSN1
MDLALKVLAQDLNEETPLTRQLEDLEFEIDSIHAFVNSALQCTNVAESNLNHRFSLLSFALASRSQLAPPVLHAASSTDSASYMPSSLMRPEPTTDPHELLRALSRLDAERPPAQVGDAARRAVRQVQRANETGLAERRLTGVSPPTPRKLPGTPRRPTTPGRDR